MIEDKLVNKSDMDDETYGRLIDKMKHKISETGIATKDIWDNEDNRIMHHKAYKRLLNSILTSKD